VLKGVADAGVDPARADLLVGSSVGAILACLIQSGQSIDDLYTLCTAGAGPFSPTRVSSAAGPAGDERSAADLQYFHECLQMWREAREDIRVRIELGARALATPNPMREETQVANMRRRLGLDGWPSGLVKIAAVDVRDGSVRFLDRSHGVPIEVAVAASCAPRTIEVEWVRAAFVRQPPLGKRLRRRFMSTPSQAYRSGLEGIRVTRAHVAAGGRRRPRDPKRRASPARVPLISFRLFPAR
jgi:hypothetical protein